MHAAITTSETYTLERHVIRAVVNSLGPILVTPSYLFIVFEYILRPSVNDVIPGYPFNAKGVFFVWLIFSIFVLDWAKSALAGFEASTLMKPALAPRSAQGLMWHADRGWGNISGWWKASKVVYSRLFRHEESTSKKALKGPGRLWFYLALNSFLLYIAIPLAGLSMDISEGFRPSDDQVWIFGANTNSFDNRPSNGIAEEANSRWRQGNPTSPHGETIFYAASGTQGVSSTYFEDSIQAIYKRDNATSTALAPVISFFSGPQVSERAQGRAWGLLTNLTCDIAHPYRDLTILKVSSVDQWARPARYIDPNSSDSAIDCANYHPDRGGVAPLLFTSGSSQGVSYVYLISSNSYTGIADSSGYVDEGALPNSGALELVMWQAYKSPYVADETFKTLLSHPSVVSSLRASDNLTYHGYGVRCSTNSSVGFADLDAATRTYSEFTTTAAKIANNSLREQYYDMNQYRGVLKIENIVYAAFTTVVLGQHGLPICTDNGTGPTECGAWFGANAATGAKYEAIVENPHFPTITPASMRLAMYKLFGESAIAMMSSGSGSWKGGLYGLTPAYSLVPGRVPWQIVVCLLSFWMIITTIPSLWIIREKRWAATLDGLEMFRLGAEWKDAVSKFEGAEIGECESLQEVPGMVGDMDSMGKVGFIGLSRDVARKEGRKYAFGGGVGE
jgi:hypothetical protein